jgi:hypothetical protein
MSGLPSVSKLSCRIKNPLPTTAIAIPGCIFNVNENGRRTARERDVIERSSSGTLSIPGAAFYLDLIGQLGGCNPGDASHSLMCEPVSACRAFRIRSSRAAPGGSCEASSRRRFASWVSRTSSGVDWMILLRRAMLVSQSMHWGRNVQRRLRFRRAGQRSTGVTLLAAPRRWSHRGPSTTKRYIRNL